RCDAVAGQPIHDRCERGGRPSLGAAVGGAWSHRHQRCRSIPPNGLEKIRPGLAQWCGDVEPWLESAALEPELARQMLIVGGLMAAARAVNRGCQQCRA